MKRSNRLFLLVGIVLAIVAAVGVLLLSGGDRETVQPGVPTPTPTQLEAVAAAQDLPIGTVLTEAQLTTQTIAAEDAPSGVVTDPAAVVGRTTRQAVRANELITEDTFGATDATSDQVKQALAQGFRAIAVQVDQISGVGTLIQPGDSVDVVLSMSETDGKNPVVMEQAPTSSEVDNETVITRNFATADQLLNNTSIKILVQNARVLGTLLPPPTETEAGQQATPTEGAAPEDGETALTGRQQIAILAVTPQQVELIRFAQLDGNLSLVLRSAADSAPDAPPAETSGITLRQLVDNYGVIPPNMSLIAPPPPAEGE